MAKMAEPMTSNNASFFRVSTLCLDASGRCVKLLESKVLKLCAWERVCNPKTMNWLLYQPDKNGAVECFSPAWVQRVLKTDDLQGHIYMWLLLSWPLWVENCLNSCARIYETIVSSRIAMRQQKLLVWEFFWPSRLFPSSTKWWRVYVWAGTSW